MKTYSIGALFALSTILMSCSAISQTTEHAQLVPEQFLVNRVNSASLDYLDTGRAAGFAIEIHQHGKVVYSDGFGKANLEWDEDASADTVFRIASITKTFTAVSVLQLIENGDLSFTDRVDKFYPDIPRASEITIENLLTHTSGLPSYNRYHSDKTDFDSYRTTEEMLQFISGLDPDSFFDPGTAYNYSNSGYYLLGAIIEQISGMSLGQYMEKNIFEPLSLEHTSMDAGEDIVPLRAAGYFAIDDKPGLFENAPSVPYTTPGAAGGLRSTVGDLSKWQRALFFDGFLPPYLLAKMMEPSRILDGRVAREVAWNDRENKYTVMDASYGYGVFIQDIDGVLEYGHSGGITGFHSEAYAYPQLGITISLIANTSGGLDPLLNIIRDIVLEELSSPSGEGEDAN